jgi:L-malate glycosyltransferase
MAAPQRGLWAERLVHAVADRVQVSVMVPTPWLPPLLPLGSLGRARAIPRSLRQNDVTTVYPRVPGSLEYVTYKFDSYLAWPWIRRAVRRVHAEQPINLVHAHFVYPDGVIAARLGRMLGVPVMTTEHAFWRPWLTTPSRPARQVSKAIRSINLITAVSEVLREDIRAVVKDAVEVDVLPNIVDGNTFTLPSRTCPERAGLLFVGLVRRAKGLDVLLRALVLLRDAGRAVRLRVLAADAMRSYRRDMAEIYSLIAELRLENLVEIRHGVPPAQVAEAMQSAALVVVPSRRESFCSVAAEALACGTPVVVTKCGGPEEFVTSDDGVLVATESPEALAAGITQTLESLDTFDRRGMRERVLRRFSAPVVAERMLGFYRSLLAQYGSKPNARSAVD